MSRRSKLKARAALQSVQAQTRRERQALNESEKASARRVDRRRWFVAEAKALCGCCTVELRFFSRESANAAFARVGLGHVTLIDDAGDRHDGIDTFYGFWEKDTQEKRGLGYLMDLVTGARRWPG